MENYSQYLSSKRHSRDSLTLLTTWIYRLTQHRMNESQAYQYFVLRAQNIALSHGYEIVNWYEAYS